MRGNPSHRQAIQRGELDGNALTRRSAGPASPAEKCVSPSESFVIFTLRDACTSDAALQRQSEEAMQRSKTVGGHTGPPTPPGPVAVFFVGLWFPTRTRLAVAYTGESELA